MSKSDLHTRFIQIADGEYARSLEKIRACVALLSEQELPAPQGEVAEVAVRSASSGSPRTRCLPGGSIQTSGHESLAEERSDEQRHEPE